MTKLNKKSKTKQHFKPISQKNLNRILVILVIILALASGYFHSALKLERKKYKRLEDSYVRVRQMIGRQEMQRLIDLSKKQQAKEAESSNN